MNQWFQDWETLLRTFGTQRLPEGKPVVPRLGGIGPNVWDYFAPLKNVSETLSLWGLCRHTFSRGDLSSGARRKSAN